MMHVAWFHDACSCVWVEFAHATDDTCCFTARITRRGPDWEAHLSGLRDSAKPGVLDAIDRGDVARDRDAVVTLLLGWLREFSLPTNLFE